MDGGGKEGVTEGGREGRGEAHQFFVFFKGTKTRVARLDCLTSASNSTIVKPAHKMQRQALLEQDGYRSSRLGRCHEAGPFKTASSFVARNVAEGTAESLTKMIQEPQRRPASASAG
jgi:hypothetical protein